MLPVMLKMAGCRAAVVGGGAAGRLKRDACLAAGAHVRVVCLEPPPVDLPPAVEWLVEPYRRDHLTGIRLVFAAATAEVNRVVVADAHALGLLAASATEPDSGDFVLPATARRGRLTVAVGTTGASPSLARRLARQWVEPLDDAFVEWLDLLAEVRPLVLNLLPDEDARRRLLEGWGDPRNLERFRRLGRDHFRTELLAEVQALAPPPARPV
jgi:precorrin-2 dehydrogenase / sirohydrochlorin ferrochelatase